MFNQDGEDLGNEQKQVLDMTKLLVEKARRCYGVQVNAGRHKWSMRWAKKVSLNVDNVILGKALLQSSCPKWELRFPL